MTSRQLEQSDASEENPFDAMARLGLALVQAEIE